VAKVRPLNQKGWIEIDQEIGAGKRRIREGENGFSFGEFVLMRNEFP